MEFDRLRGKWEVRQMMEHLPAQLFWRRVIAEYSGGDYGESVRHIEECGIDMVVQGFKSRDGAWAME
jgi:predicted acetyltransferase